MNRLVIAMPRSPSFIILAIGVTGLSVTILTAPTFIAGHGLSGFSLGRWGAILLSVLTILWAIKGLFSPSILFACSRSGIEIPVYHRVIPWQEVLDIQPTSMTVGHSNTANRVKPIQSKAIVIRLSENIVLTAGLRPNSHGRITAKHEYTFSTAVQRMDRSSLLKTIEEFRT